MNDYLDLLVNVNVQSDGLRFIWITVGGIANSFVSTKQSLAWKELLAQSEKELPQSPHSASVLLNKVGIDVFETLFTQDVQHCWNNTLRDRSELPIRLVFAYNKEDAATLALVPLEAMYCPLEMQGKVARIVGEVVRAPGVSIVRKIFQSPDLDRFPLQVDLPLKVLVIASQPTDLPESKKLPKLEIELQNLESQLRELGDMVQFKILRPGQANFAELQTRGPDYHVIHFIGHGGLTPDEKDAQFLFEDSRGLSDWHTGTDVAAELIQGQTRLFFLNGCKMGAAAVLACRFPAVIGTWSSIYDASAVAFSAGLYQTLTNTGQLDEAVDAGRKQIGKGPHSHRWERVKPVLHMHSDTGLLALIRPISTIKELPEGRSTSPYQATVSTLGGRKPHQFDADTTKLPPGLTMDSRTGVITGTPTAAGTFTLPISITSRDNQTTQTRIPLKINPDGPDVFRITTKEIG